MQFVERFKNSEKESKLVQSRLKDLKKMEENKLEELTEVCGPCTHLFEEH